MPQPTARPCSKVRIGLVVEAFALQGARLCAPRSSSVRTLNAKKRSKGNCGARLEATDFAVPLDSNPAFTAEPLNQWHEAPEWSQNARQVGAQHSWVTGIWARVSPCDVGTGLEYEPWGAMMARSHLCSLS